MIEASLVPIAAELVGTLRDYSLEDVDAVLARVPESDHLALVKVLAAMIDPDASPRELLAWTTAGPVRSREKDPGQLRSEWASYSRRILPREHGTERGYQQHRSRDDMPACDPCLSAHRADETARKGRRRAKQKPAAKSVAVAS